VIPVWNTNSNREHLIGRFRAGRQREKPPPMPPFRGTCLETSLPRDADHINLGTVDRFIRCQRISYTLDVASAIGQPAPAADVAAFVGRHPDELIGRLSVPGIAEPFATTRHVGRGGRPASISFRRPGSRGRMLSRTSRSAKAPIISLTEVSMDETDSPQTPPELIVILAAIADEKDSPHLQTIARRSSPAASTRAWTTLADLAQLQRNSTTTWR